MANAWDKFDKEIDVESLAKDVKQVNDNGGIYKEVPHGQYEIKIEKLELVESKAGNPMFSCWMRIIAGEYKGSMIFMNQVMNRDFQIHNRQCTGTNDFLENLESGLDIEFKTYRQYGQLLMDVAEAIDGKLEYGLKYGENKKGFSTYEITDVYEVEE